MDLRSLSLPDNQDALIQQVAAANPHTIVVLETGTAVTMPWLDNVAGVVEAWFAGSAGHKALANVLVGDVNPSGKLAITFPKSEQDLPHPVIPPLSFRDRGQGSHAVNAGTSGSGYSVTYNEGPEVGYKWFEAQHKQPLFRLRLRLVLHHLRIFRLEGRVRRQNCALHRQEHRHSRRH